MSTHPSTLQLRHVRKVFGSTVALDDVSLDVGEHEFVCLLGPSGCGKTTLLRLIAGLASADAGTLHLNGQDLTHVPARDRGFGIVFQSYSLFPSMTVAQNVGYGLKIRGVASRDIDARVTELLDMVRLSSQADRLPWQLSGGQQQRVAFARAVAFSPKLLLLDEPLSALDAKVRSELRQEIRRLQRDLGIPTLMVTHDQEEAMALSDRIVCMDHGRVAQVGTPEDLYCRPTSRFVADFMGVSNLVDAATWRRLSKNVRRPVDGADPGAWVCIRPEQLRVASAQASPDPGAFSARVMSVQFLGNLSRLALEAEGHTWMAEVPGVRSGHRELKCRCHWGPRRFIGCRTTDGADDLDRAPPSRVEVGR